MDYSASCIVMVTQPLRSCTTWVQAIKRALFKCDAITEEPISPDVGPVSLTALRHRLRRTGLATVLPHGRQSARYLRGFQHSGRSAESAGYRLSASTAAAKKSVSLTVAMPCGLGSAPQTTITTFSRGFM